MIWGMWTGIVGRIRTQLAASDLARRASEREQRELETARQLDADEVGRRADEHRVEREAQAQSDSPTRR